MAREAKLTLRLVDAVSGPGRAAAAALRGLHGAMAGIGNVAAFPGRALAEQARSIQRASAALAPVSAGIGIGAASAARQVYDMERALNVSVAAGGLTMDQRNAFMEEAIRLNAEYAATAGEIVDAGNKLLRAGLGYDQMMGSLPGVLSTAQAMDVPMEAASAAVVNSMVSMQMAMHDTQSTMRSSIRTADLYAHAVNATTGELDDFAVSSRYFNPVAAAIGLSPESAMAYQIALAKSGILGSSAGTGLRSAPVSIADPSKKARQAFGRLGINPADFTGQRTSDANGASIAAALEAAGFTAEGIETAIDGVLSDPAMRAAPARAAIQILDRVGEEIGVTTAEDRALVSDAIQRAIMSGVKEVDLVGALRALREKGAGLADFTAIFGRNHASKMLALDPAIFDSALADIEANAAGTSYRMREAMMAGIVGDVAEFTAAIEKMSISIGKAGLLADASKAIVQLSKSLDELAGSNPALLRFGSYAALALAAAAPLGLALSGLAAVAGLVVSPVAIAAAGLASLAIINFLPIANGIRTFSNALRAAVAPSVVAAVGRGRVAVGELFGALRLHHLALNRLAARLGGGLGDAINRLAGSAPQLREIGAAFAPLASAARDFVGSKWSALKDAGAIIAGFASRAGPAMSPALASGIELVAGSLDLLGRGASAVGRLMGGALEGILAFGRGVLEGIDPSALAAAGRGVTAVLDGLALPLDRLRRLFDTIDLDVAGLARRIGGALGTGISWIVQDLARGHTALTGAWDTLRSTLVSIGSYVPDFSTIVAGIRSFVGFMSEAAAGLKSAAETIASIRPFGGGRGDRRGDVFGDGSVPVGGGSGVAPGSGTVGTVPTDGGDGTAPRDGGGRATGGLARAGFRYEVNERGIEAITMGGRSAWITPAHEMEDLVSREAPREAPRPMMPAPLDVSAIVASIARPHHDLQPARGSDVFALPRHLAAAPQAEPFDLSSLARSVGADRDRGRPEVRISISGNSFHGVSRADAKGFADELGRQLSRSPQVAMD